MSIPEATGRSWHSVRLCRTPPRTDPAGLPASHRVRRGHRPNGHTTTPTCLPGPPCSPMYPRLRYITRANWTNKGVRWIVGPAHRSRYSGAAPSSCRGRRRRRHRRRRVAGAVTERVHGVQPHAADVGAVLCPRCHHRRQHAPRLGHPRCSDHSACPGPAAPPIVALMI